MATQVEETQKGFWERLLVAMGPISINSEEMKSLENMTSLEIHKSWDSM